MKKYKNKGRHEGKQKFFVYVPIEWLRALQWVKNPTQDEVTMELLVKADENQIILRKPEDEKVGEVQFRLNLHHLKGARLKKDSDWKYYATKEGLRINARTNWKKIPLIKNKKDIIKLEELAKIDTELINIRNKATDMVKSSPELKKLGRKKVSYEKKFRTKLNKVKKSSAFLKMTKTKEYKEMKEEESKLRRANKEYNEQFEIPKELKKERDQLIAKKDKIVSDWRKKKKPKINKNKEAKKK